MTTGYYPHSRQGLADTNSSMFVSNITNAGSSSRSHKYIAKRKSRLCGTETTKNLFEEDFTVTQENSPNTRENSASPDDMFTYEDDFSDDSDCML
ncbi:hypothetical protein ACET3Z_004242 [Daucus carota]